MVFLPHLRYGNSVSSDEVILVTAQSAMEKDPQKWQIDQKVDTKYGKARR